MFTFSESLFLYAPAEYNLWTTSKIDLPSIVKGSYQKLSRRVMGKMCHKGLWGQGEQKGLKIECKEAGTGQEELVNSMQGTNWI